MKATSLEIADVLLIELVVYQDDRGYFKETYRQLEYQKLGIKQPFVQDNQTSSTRGTLRGLHYQIPNPQGKLLQVLRGKIFDVVVDMRAASSTLGKWVAIELAGEDHTQLWIPPGFAHGFYVLSSQADVAYKVTDYYSPTAERVLLWNDPELGIPWPLLNNRQPLLSEKDQRGQLMKSCKLYTDENIEQDA